MKLKHYINFLVSSLLLISLYCYFFIINNNNLVEDNSAVVQENVDYYKEEGWEEKYLHLNSNTFTGNGIKIAVLDTEIDSNMCNKAMYKGTFSKRKLHGDKVAQLIKKISKNANIYCVPVASPSGYVKEKDFIEGLKWAIKQDVDIINMSLGFKQAIEKVDPILMEAYKNNIVLIAASGNNGQEKLDYPASSSYVIGVGALNTDTDRWEYSNYGTELDFVLPGSSIKIEDEFVEGTSYSAAILTGMVARIKEEFPNSTPDFIFKRLIKMTSNETRINDYKGYGTPTF